MNEELMAQGERLHQEYLEALDKATPEQMEMANLVTEQTVSEYRIGFAAILCKIVNT